MEKKTFSFAEVASELGISENELIEFAKSEGLLDENGLPTEKAIENGLLATEIVVQSN